MKKFIFVLAFSFIIPVFALAAGGGSTLPAPDPQIDPIPVPTATSTPILTEVLPESGMTGTLVTVFGQNFGGHDDSILLDNGGPVKLPVWTGMTPTGNSIAFTLPSKVCTKFVSGAGSDCLTWTPVNPGSYSLYFFNGALNSNSLPFTVTSGSTSTTPSIKITNPLGGATLYKGQTYKIAWNSTGVNGLINIALFQGTTNKWIAYNIPNTGNFNWTIPTNTVSGSNYGFGINSTDLPKGGYTTNNISILAANATPLDLAKQISALVGQAITQNNAGNWVGDILQNIKSLLVQLQPLVLNVYHSTIALFTPNIAYANGGGGTASTTPPTPTNLPPSISGVAGPVKLDVGQTGTWTVNASDPEDETLNYKVMWGDEAINPPPPITNSVTQTATFTHTYSKAGNYTPTFIVTDDIGQAAQTSLSVVVGNGTISNLPPIVGIDKNDPTPKLSTEYDPAHPESPFLTNSFYLNLTAQQNDVFIPVGGGGFASLISSDGKNLLNISEDTSSGGVPVQIVLDQYGIQFIKIPKGQTVKLNFTRKFSSSVLFGGSYYASFSGIHYKSDLSAPSIYGVGFGPLVTNQLAVVGELSPYLYNAVATNANEYTIYGVRLNSNDTITLNPTAAVTNITYSIDGKSIRFNAVLPIGGNYMVVVKDAKYGTSNAVPLNVVADVPTVKDLVNQLSALTDQAISLAGPKGTPPSSTLLQVLTQMNSTAYQIVNALAAAQAKMAQNLFQRTVGAAAVGVLDLFNLVFHFR